MPYGISLSFGELIARLEKENQDNPGKFLRFGFRNPHSYRGFYEGIAFEPANKISVEEMLASAKDALGKTFQGWKGGDYIMGEHTPVYIGEYGDCGDPITPTHFKYWVLTGRK